jgi:hypothetical protein
MRPPVARHLLTAVAACLTLSASAGAGERPLMPNMLPIANGTGMAATFSTSGSIDVTGAFFQAFGTNDRACVTCHQPSEGWTVTPVGLQQRFEATQGLDPVFRTNDGASSPLADVSTVDARRAAYAMLLDKGLIRVGIGIPPDAEFDLVGVDDPYRFASTSELSLFRRVLPATNLTFLSTLMWDARETFLDPNSTDCLAGTSRRFASMHFNLSHQANAATEGHAQATQPLSQAQREEIVNFETKLFTAQIFDDAAGGLWAGGRRTSTTAWRGIFAPSSISTISASASD